MAELGAPSHQAALEKHSAAGLMEVKTVPTEPEAYEVNVTSRPTGALEIPEAASNAAGDFSPGEYKTFEELEAAYQKFKKPVEPGQPEKTEAAPPVPEDQRVADVEVTSEVVPLLQKAGVSIERLQHEIHTAGTLSDDSYTRLAQAGFDRATVDAYIEGQRVIVQRDISSIKDSVGGEDSYQAMIGWAAVNLSETEKEAYDRVMHSNDVGIIKMAAAGLKAKYDQALGRAPERVLTGSAGGGGDKRGYESWAQVKAAMRDPRYSSDPAYRRSVEAKLISSNL